MLTLLILILIIDSWEDQLWDIKEIGKKYIKKKIKIIMIYKVQIQKEININKCDDYKHNFGLCKVCIKDKLFYIGIDLGKGDDKTEININR